MKVVSHASVLLHCHPDCPCGPEKGLCLDVLSMPLVPACIHRRHPSNVIVGWQGWQVGSRLWFLLCVGWLKAKRIFFFLGKRAKSWRPHFRGERHPIPFDGGNTSNWPRGASSGRVAWRDCKGLTDGQRGPANDGRLRSRGSRKSGDGTHELC
ncbi:hypothetical protein B0T20DRAFT_405674 [Sordaria brevicollis]|uniref:Uncharacterized protein n=1 Tax=Sordaria brevicollis TaxID=83679 RepID=A0AAE0PJ76_SORBR|nr:hypothetical protein B0T20DRAFT_405674 [Sordaria brevicollis]